MSVPFFVHPRFTAVIETIPTTITDDNPARYEPVVAGEWVAAKHQSMLEG
jgi:isopenicillin N synthase-like dioxygenase